MRKYLVTQLILVCALLIGSFIPSSVMAQNPEEPDVPTNIYLPIVGTEQSDEDAQATVTFDVQELDSADVPIKEQQAVESFWTREMLLKAEALDVLRVSAEEANLASQVSESLMSAAGPAEVFPGGPPEPEAADEAQQLYSEEWARISEVEQSAELNVTYGAAETSYNFSSDPPFNSYYVNTSTNTWQESPYKAMGRLFYQIPGSTELSACSASVAYGRAVWTAGHCVFTPGKGWHTNMVFVPAYRDGSKPFGEFTVLSRAALKGWTREGKEAYDIGMVTVKDNDGRSVSEWVGWLGFIRNASSSQLFHAFGYPRNLGNNGRYLIACVASTYGRDSQSGPDPLGIGCDMTYGASGGPWIINYAPFSDGASNYANGVNAYIHTDRPNFVYSPYFGDGAKALYQWGRAR